MECKHCRQAVQSAQPVGLKIETAPEVQAHLETCRDCRLFAEDRIFKALLSPVARSVPAPAADFKASVVRQALAYQRPGQQQNNPGSYRHAVMAAGVMLALLLGVLMTNSPAPVPGHQVAVTQPPEAVRPVSVLLNTPKAIPGAVITVHLDDHTALDGYPENQTISWQTDLRAGPNKLTLPVQLLDSATGNIRIELEYQNTRKELLVPVNRAASADRDNVPI